MIDYATFSHGWFFLLMQASVHRNRQESTVIIPEKLKRLMQDIDFAIDDVSLTNRERDGRLWNLAQLFWMHAFPADISQDDRHALWVTIVGECDIENCKNGCKILDVLKWPATGEPPSWI